jgi:predicted phosphodiesterase
MGASPTRVARPHVKIQIASDLHLEFFRRGHPDYRVIEPAPAADLLVLAGDIEQGSGAQRMFANWPVPVIWVAGNHEFYKGSYEAVQEQFAGRPRLGATRYLENAECVFNGVRFLGATLWTDYRLAGTPRASKAIAREQMLDHKLIEYHKRPFTPARAQTLHLRTRKWLESKLDEPFDGRTVVVTHHGVHPDSVHAKYAGDDCNPAFVSDLSPLLGKAALWIHGHTHSSFDYTVGAARIVVNPRGYCGNRFEPDPARFQFENPDFIPGLTIEV